MIKSIAVWILLIFLRSWGRSINTQKISNYNKNYHKGKRTNVERLATRKRRIPLRNTSYNAATKNSRQVMLYSKNGKTVRVKTSLAGRRYNYA